MNDTVRAIDATLDSLCPDQESLLEVERATMIATAMRCARKLRDTETSHREGMCAILTEFFRIHLEMAVDEMTQTQLRENSASPHLQ